MPELNGREHWSLVGNHSESEDYLTQLSRELSEKIYKPQVPIPMMFREPDIKTEINHKQSWKVTKVQKKKPRIYLD